MASKPAGTYEVLLNAEAPEDINDAVLEMLKQGATVESMRLVISHYATPGSNTPSRCGVVDYTQFSHEFVAQTWGYAGEFCADLQTRDSRWPGNRRRGRFGISPAMLPKTAPAQMGGVEKPIGLEGMMAAMMQMTLSAQQQQTQVLTALIGRPERAPQTSPVMETLVSTLLAKALERTPVSEVLALREALGDAQGPRGEEKDSTLSIVREGVKLVGTLAEAAKAAPSPAGQAAQAATTATAATPATTPASVSTDPATLGEFDRLKLFAARIGPELVSFASDAKPNAEAAAQFCVSVALRVGIDPVAAFAASADKIEAKATEAIDALKLIYPPIGAHERFVRQVWVELAEEYGENAE